MPRNPREIKPSCPAAPAGRPAAAESVNLGASCGVYPPNTGARSRRAGRCIVRLAGPEYFVLFVVFVLVAAVVAVPVGIALFAWTFGRRARRFGYPSAGAYLQSAPGSDAEKRDA